MDALFNKILDTIKQNRACVSATVVASFGSSPRKIGAKMVVFGDGEIEGTIGGGALEKAVIADALVALKRRKSFLKEYLLDRRSGLQACGGKVSIFIDVLEPSLKLMICGAGHIGLALSLIAKLLNFTVVVVDNRRAFANEDRFPHADQIICGPYVKAFKKVAPDQNTYVVIVTHGHLHDAECLEAALKSEAGYIGMIGSRLKIKHIFSQFLKKGFRRNQLDQLHSPVGLDIGAQTPEEIAVAIAAEMIKVKSKK